MRSGERAKYRTRATQQKPAKRRDSVDLCPFSALVYFSFLLPRGGTASPGILSKHVRDCLLGSDEENEVDSQA